MAKEVRDDEKTEYESSDEVEVLALYKYSKKELTDALISSINLEEMYLSKYKDFKKVVQQY